MVMMDSLQHGHVTPARVIVPAATRVSLAALGGVVAFFRYVGPHAEDHTCLVGLGRHGQQHSLIILLAKPTGLEKGDFARQFLQVTVRAQR